LSDRERVLLTPGPLSTSRAVREAMLRDLGSRDVEFLAITARVRERLLALAGAEASHACVPLQGSGTFAVEAAIGTLVPADGQLLVASNGAYGRRMAAIAGRLGRPCSLLELPETSPVDPEAVARALAGPRPPSHLAVVHCETSTGIRNPLEAVAAVAARARVPLLVDAMSTFGALPVDARRTPFTALVASANKCLQGVPGVGFALVERTALAAARGRAPSLALDLFDQHEGFERTGQWRFTPPTHVVAALARALDELEAEGGVAARGRRYAESCRVLVAGMRKLGFETLLPDALQAPIIVTFLAPADPRFVFDAFYDGLRRRGFVIYPGKLSETPSFRIGCIGDVSSSDLERAVAAVAETLGELGVSSPGTS